MEASPWNSSKAVSISMRVQISHTFRRLYLLYRLFRSFFSLIGKFLPSRPTTGVSFTSRPRWLTEKGQMDAARATLAHLHANGDIDDPFVLNQMTDIKAAIDKSRQIGESRFVPNFYFTLASTHLSFLVGRSFSPLRASSVASALGTSSIFRSK